MSFIVSRDVFDMPDSEVEQLGNLYDKLEEAYQRDWVKEEYSPVYPFDDVPKDKLPFSIDGWDMLVYIHNKMKDNDAWQEFLSG